MISVGRAVEIYQFSKGKLVMRYCRGLLIISPLLMVTVASAKSLKEEPNHKSSLHRMQLEQICRSDGRLRCTRISDVTPDNDGCIGWREICEEIATPCRDMDPADLIPQVSFRTCWACVETGVECISDDWDIPRSPNDAPDL